jgi:hypothetical protein
MQSVEQKPNYFRENSPLRVHSAGNVSNTPYQSLRCPKLGGMVPTNEPKPAPTTSLDSNPVHSKSDPPISLRQRLGEKLESSAGMVGDVATLGLAYGAQVALFASSPVAYAAISGSLLKFSLHSLLLTPLAVFFANITIDSVMSSVEHKLFKAKQQGDASAGFANSAKEAASKMFNQACWVGLKIISLPVSQIGAWVSDACLKVGQLLQRQKPSTTA